MQTTRRTWIVTAALCVAMGGDVFTTWYGIEHAGLYEANAAVAPYLDAYGYAVMFVGKGITVVIALAAVGVCAWLWDDADSWVVYSPVYAVIALNAVVTAHNGMLILSA